MPHHRVYVVVGIIEKMAKIDEGSDQYNHYHILHHTRHRKEQVKEKKYINCDILMMKGNHLYINIRY